MFKELLPMVRNRKVTIIIKHNEDDTLTVNVVPIQIRPDENPALCTPLSDTGVTGTAEDFDREFPQALTAYVAQHLSLAAALAQSAAEMETAKKSAADAAKQSSKDASEKWKKTKAGAPTMWPRLRPRRQRHRPLPASSTHPHRRCPPTWRRPWRQPQPACSTRLRPSLPLPPQSLAQSPTTVRMQILNSTMARATRTTRKNKLPASLNALSQDCLSSAGSPGAHGRFPPSRITTQAEQNS